MLLSTLLLWCRGCGLILLDSAEAQYTSGSLLHGSLLTAPSVVLLAYALLTCVAVLQEMRDEIAKQFTERPWYTSGSTLQVSRLTAPSVVLLGDAAHAVSAAFGQGVNAALEVGHWPYTPRQG